MPIPFSEAVTTPTIIPWAVTATHNFLSQEISATTSLITAGLDTPGTENYVADYLLTDYNIVLPQIGTTSHFVSPNQPVFTFTKATRVLMLIPVTTSINLLKSQGWVYVKPTNSVAAFVDDYTYMITNSPADYFFEKMYAAGTHNLDPNQQAPLAFYFFEERTFDEQVPVNTSSIGANTEMLSAISGSRGGKALIVHSTGKVGLGTADGTTPDAKLHVVGDVKATGFVVAKPQFYQTTNSYKNNVNSKPIDLVNASKLNNSGLASQRGNWVQFTGWQNPLTNSSTSTFEAVSNHSVKCKVSGYYRATCQMHFYSLVQDTSVAIRFATFRPNVDSYPLVDDVQDFDWENPGPCQISGTINNGSRQAGSASLSHVVTLIANDELSVYTSKAGTNGQVVTGPAGSSLRLEFMGPS